jgi:hypothetical protein
MIRKSGNRFSLATNAERVCAEIMLKQREEIMILSNWIKISGMQLQFARAQGTIVR